MEYNIVNILFDRWQGYNPIYWSSKDRNYLSYYNVWHEKYPKRYSGYRIMQKIYKNSREYKVENEYFYGDQVIEKKEFTKIIPLNKFICRPIKKAESFLYRIILPITPSSSFFDSLENGYYIRDVFNCYNPKTYYDPFTFSVLKDYCLTYVKKEQSITDLIDYDTYPYVGRDILIEHAYIESFLKKMKEYGWTVQNPLFSQEDVYNQLEKNKNKINYLKNLFTNKEIKEKYFKKIFQCTNKKQLEKLKGEMHIEIADIYNSFSVVWDESLELKNIYRQFMPLKISKDISLEDVQKLYNAINKLALKEITTKKKLLMELAETIQWKKNYIDNFSDFNLYKNWILTAVEPFYTFRSQLEIKDSTIYYNKDQLYNDLVFLYDRYRLILNNNISIKLKEDKGDKSPQEQLKMLLRDYNSNPEPYTKRRIKKQIESIETTLKMIKELKSIYLKDEKGQDKIE